MIQTGGFSGTRVLELDMSKDQQFVDQDIISSQGSYKSTNFPKVINLSNTNQQNFDASMVAT